MPDDRRGSSCQPDREGSPAPSASEQSPRLVKAEANLLRLPLFALHTKRLKTLDGIECRGRTTRDGRTHQLLFRATRNTATLYPGPLARSAHLAFLSILTEAGFPRSNPLTWRWRDLCRRMGVVYGGQIVRHLKEAITSTAGLLLWSESALYSKAEGTLLQTQQEALHLYDRVAFVGSVLPDGRTADANYLWLSDWYLDNLNALFTAPLDYSLWRQLDERSPIASRLYEFLLLNFYSGAPLLRINYETLAQFLPVRPERYLSDARRQLEAAFQVLAATGVLAGAEWAAARDSLGQLRLYRGPRLSGPRGKRQPASSGDAIPDTIAVKELRNLRPPEWQLVSDFYHLWAGQDNARPTKKELLQASELIDRHGQAKAKALVPLLVRRLKEQWPEARTFGAVARYVPDAIEDHQRQQRHAQREREERQQQRQEQEEQGRKRAEEERWQAVWQGLGEAERQSLRAEVLARNPHLARRPKLVERFCLGELARRQQQQVP